MSTDDKNSEPRTDAFITEQRDCEGRDYAHKYDKALRFARQLERELAETKRVAEGLLGSHGQLLDRELERERRLHELPPSSDERIKELERERSNVQAKYAYILEKCAKLDSEKRLSAMDAGDAISRAAAIGLIDRQDLMYPTSADWLIAEIRKLPAKGLPPVEEVSARVHDAWMASKRAQGVTTRKAEDGEELMVPYEQLSEKAKQLDRGTVQAVYAAMAQ